MGYESRQWSFYNSWVTSPNQRDRSGTTCHRECRDTSFSGVMRYGVLSARQEAPAFRLPADQSLAMKILVP